MTDPTRYPAEAPWHVQATDLERYARGEALPGQAASIEPHLASCARCQAAIADTAALTSGAVQQRLSLVLDEVIESVDAPTPRRLERVLLRAGVPDHIARVVAASPQMERSWLYAVAAILTFTVLATRSGDVGLGLFLVVAPLLPLAVVAASFSLTGANLAELTVTMPVRASWLLMLRSVSVLVPTFAMCGAAAIALPDHGWEQAAWVLPALALSSMAAALSTWVRPVTAALALTASWLVALALASGRIVRSLDPGPLAEHDAVFASSGQLVALVLTCISLLVLFKRREVLDTRSPA
jgi:anti-sigma factor RsiW